MPVIINGTTGLSGVSTVNLANGSVTQNILANGVSTTGPAFSAWNNGTQSLSGSVNTKVLFGSEEYDTANCFASSRFTPNVAGYYFVSTQIRNNSVANSQNWYMEFWKNGAVAYRGQETFNLSGSAPMVQMASSRLIYMNGTTDYLEIYCWSAAAASIGYAADVAYANTFQAFLARAA